MQYTSRWYAGNGGLGSIILAIGIAVSNVAALPMFGETLALGNSSFDVVDASSGAISWRLTNGFRLEKNGGHNGSGGLVWSASERSAKVASAVQDVAGLQKGNKVRLSALVKTEGLKSEGRYGAHVTLELYDTDRKWIAALYARKSRVDNPKDGEWVLRTVTGVVPANFGSARVAIHVAEGTVGSFAVDNVTVERVEANPVQFVVSSAYHGTAVGGKVRFHASLDTPAEALGKAKVEFVWQDANGKLRRSMADSLSEDAASVTLDVGRFAKGKQQVRCEMQLDGRCIGDAAVAFERLDKPKERRVWIDESKRCIVNGKPFFPIGTYCYPSVQNLESLTNTPFNAVVHYMTPDKKLLETFERLGLMTCAAFDRNFSEEELRRRIPMIKESPAVLAWYVGDEFSIDKIPELRRLYGLARELDDDHPVYLVQDRLYDLRDFLPFTDVIGLDPYPVPEKPVRQVTDFMRGGREKMFDVCANWSVPQTFDWSWYARPKDKNRFPNETELRSMLWQHIAGGANGIFSFRYHSVTSDTWKLVLKTHREIADRTDILLSDGVEAKSSDEAMPCRAWRKDGVLYVLACNILDRPMTATVTVADGNWKPVSADFGAMPTGGGREFAFELPALGVSLVRLMPASAGTGNPFEQKIDLQTAELSVGDHGRFERTEEGIRIILPRYDGRTEGQRWPAVNIALPEDCSAYDSLEYGMFARKGGNFSITFRDKRGKSDFEHKQADGEQKQLPIYTADLSVRGRFDFTKMKSFTVYRSHPGDDAEFLLKSMRLVSSVPKRAVEMAAAFASIGQTAEARECEKLPDRVRRGELTAKEASVRLVRMQADYTALRLADIRKRSAAVHQNAAFAVAEMDDLERVRPENDPLTASLRVGEWSLELARREREGMQVLVFSPADRALTNVTISASDFRDGAGNLLPVAEAAPVGRVTVKSTKGPSHFLGEHFDPVCDFTNAVAEVGANRIEAFHVRFRAKPNTSPGTYRGTVTIVADDAGRADVPVTVVVRNVTLPVESTIRTATSCYGSKVMGKEIARFKDWVLDEYRLNPMSIYTAETPSVEECREKVSRGMSYIPLLYLQNPPDSHFEWRGRKKGFTKRDEYWKTLSDEERAHYPPEAIEDAIAKLRKAIPEFKAAGLFKYAACYSFDEYAGSFVPAIGEFARAVKREFPDLRIDSTAVPSEDPRTLGLIEGWIPTTDAYDYNTAEKFRHQYGNQVWYYTIYLTVDMDTLATVRAELGSRAFAQKVDGWLVWTVSRWGGSNDKPIVSAGATGWNPESFPGLNGGGSYFCMGPNGRFLPTLRAEAIRDGIEDHCLFSQLKTLDDPRAKAFLERLDPTRKAYDAATQRRLRHEAFDILDSSTK